MKGIGSGQLEPERHRQDSETKQGKGSQRPGQQAQQWSEQESQSRRNSLWFEDLNSWQDRGE